MCFPKFFLIFGALLLIGCIQGAALNHQLILDYLRYLGNVQYTTTFSCSEESESIDLSRSLFELNIKHNLVNIENVNETVNVKEHLFYKVPGKHVAIVDCFCPNYMEALLQASQDKFFNLTYFWLIIDGKGEQGIDVILDPVAEIAINSQISFAKIGDSRSSSYTLYDVWSYGRHLDRTIHISIFAVWTRGEGLRLKNENPSHMFDKNNRGDLKGLRLRAVTVIDKDNVSSDDVDQILRVIRVSDGISPFVRYHYFLIQILLQRYNFTVKYRITRAWAGRLPSGYRLGLLGVMQRNEADIAATGMFSRINRHDDFDYYHSSWKFEAAFLFRVTPDLTNSQGNGSFFIPFERDVWLVFGVTLLLLLAVLKFITLCCRRFFGHEEEDFLEFVVDVVGGIAQQGLNSTTNFTPIRIVLINLLVMTLLLYNYYTYFVVGGLLSTPAKGPETVRELIDSPLSLSFEDIGYHKILFRESNASIVKELQRKKLQGPRKALPIYTTIQNVIPYLRQGGYAFHAEAITTYPEISKSFKSNEICDLRIVPGVMETNMMIMMQSKNNMYTEMFKIEMTRALETGLVRKWLMTIKNRKPECQSAATVHPVTIDRVKSAFYILSLGVIIAIVVLGAEKLSYKLKVMKMNHESARRPYLP